MDDSTKNSDPKRTVPADTPKGDAESPKTAPASGVGDADAMKASGAGAADAAATPGNKRRKRLLWILSSVGTVIVLSLIIYGVWALTSSPEPEVRNVDLSPQSQSETLYKSGMEALESGDTSAAVKLFAKAITVDPTNKGAREQLESIQPPPPAGSSSSNGSSDDEPSDVDGDDDGDPGIDEAFFNPVSSLLILLPASVDGYTLGAPLATAEDAQVSAEPETPGGSVRSATFYVHDMVDVASADSFVANQMHIAFPENGADVSVEGTPGYFGTDGTRLAVVSFSRGRYAFEVILASGVSPGTLLDTAVQAAEAFPTSL